MVPNKTAIHRFDIVVNYSVRSLHFHKITKANCDNLFTFTNSTLKRNGTLKGYQH